MKSFKYLLTLNLLLITSTCFAFVTSHQSKKNQEVQVPLKIWFDEPTSMAGTAIWYANRSQSWNVNNKLTSIGDGIRNMDQEWENLSLPIGNGHIGANILGSIEAERITFNEKSFWRGGPNTSPNPDNYWNVNKQSAHYLDSIREAFTKTQYTRVDSLTKKYFKSDVPYEASAESPFRFGSFTSMGEFYIQTGLSSSKISDYIRQLSLDSALVTVQFDHEKVTYTRKYFISYPDNILAVYFEANEPNRQNLKLSYAHNPVSKLTITRDGKDELLYHGFLDDNGMEYAIRVKALSNGGSVNNTNNYLSIDGATSVLFIITADTDYKINFDPDFTDPKTYVGENPLETTSQCLSKAEQQSYEQLLQNHYDDYSLLFKRVNLTINNSTDDTSIPTPQRLSNYRQGISDHYLEQLYFQYGRYLLIASSRPGNLPANLQGIWHNNVDGPWRVDYHNNINLQMNYWPAGITNLNECAIPLIDFIRSLVKPGKITAQSYYGTRGWTASISSNIFGFTSPLNSEDMSWNFNPMAGPWLASHIWDYYEYTQDINFLKNTGYKIIKMSAQFASDFLWKKEDGTYTAAPSTSPEHGPIDEGTTFTHAVIREILIDAIQASEILNVDVAEREAWKNILVNLVPYQIGRYGQLMEWSADIDDPTDEHRHVNHLFGLHPGKTISPITTPKLSEASKIVLEHRGDGATGWSMGWKLNQWARLHDGDHAYTLFSNLLKNGTLDNLWDTHPPFQIDGNFGGTAGVAEMLVQTHMGFIHLLPALPTKWHSGSIDGLLAKGAFEVSINWKKGILENATIKSIKGKECTVRYKDQSITFPTTAKHTYQILFKQNKLSYRVLKSKEV